MKNDNFQFRLFTFSLITSLFLSMNGIGSILVNTNFELSKKIVHEENEKINNSKLIEPIISLCVWGEPIEPGSTFEFWPDEYITVDLCDILSGEEPFDICYDTNGENNCVNGIYLGDPIIEQVFSSGEYVIQLTSITDANGNIVPDLSNYYFTIEVLSNPLISICINGEINEPGNIYAFNPDELVEVTICEIQSGQEPFDIDFEVNGQILSASSLYLGDPFIQQTFGTGNYYFQLLSITDANGMVTPDLSDYNFVLEIMDIPHVNAGDDEIICEDSYYFIESASASNYSMLFWNSSGDGTFDDNQILHTTYFPGLSDIANNQVTLTLEAYSNSGFEIVSDEMVLNLQNFPTVFAGEDATINQNGYLIEDAYAGDYASLIWQTSGDGNFDNETIINPTYTAGADDIAAGSVLLTLFAQPVSPCLLPAEDDLILTIENTVVAPPVLISPISTTLTGPPYIFKWEASSNSVGYHIMVSESIDFSVCLVNDSTISGNETIYSSNTELSYGVYYWRVRAKSSSSGEWSTWSNTPWFTAQPPVQLHGQITDQTTATGIEGALLTLSNQNTSLTIQSLFNGMYQFDNVPPGNYLLTVEAVGYQDYQKEVLVEGESMLLNIELLPEGLDFLQINGHLKAYADNIVEEPSNYFKLAGNVNINNILYFAEAIEVDLRSSNFLVDGNCKIFAKTQSGEYSINNTSLSWEFLVQDEYLVINNENQFFEVPFFVQGFPLTLNAIEVDQNGEFVSAKVIPKFPFPLDEVVQFYTKPKELSEFSFAKTFDDEGEHIDDFELIIENFNMTLFKINSLQIQYEYVKSQFSGGIEIQIPGTPTKGRNEKLGKTQSESMKIPVKITDTTGKTQQIIPFSELLSFINKRAEPITIEFGIGFVDGKIDSLFASADGLNIPLPIQGMAITKIKGGVYNLTSKQITITAGVDIETGFGIPNTTKSPLKLSNFGVTIKPWDYFQGNGTIEIMDKPISEGKITYVKNNSLTLKGWWEAGIMRGNVDVKIAKRKLSGNSDLIIKTPEKDEIKEQWLKWLGGVEVGTVPTTFNFDVDRNEYFITTKFEKEIEVAWGFVKRTFSATQRFSFDSNFPYVHLEVGLNHNNLIQIFKGQKDGKAAIQFQVPENTTQMYIVAEDTINPQLFDFSLQNPLGQYLNDTNTYYEKFDDVKQTVMIVDKPIVGDWFFLTEYDGDVALYTLAVDQEPTILSTEPQPSKTRSKEIAVTINDFADTCNVEVFYDIDKNGFDGVFIDDFEITNNGSVEFTWRTEDVVNGEYYIYSKVDDGENAPVLQYAPGSIWVENDPDIETPQNFSAIQMSDSVVCSWNAPTINNIIATTTYWKNISNGKVNEQTTTVNGYLSVSGFDPGQEYEMWACFINENGTYSEPSNNVSLIYSNSSRNNPPYFTLDPDSTFVFVVDQPGKFQLTANDLDGDSLTFDLPYDTLGVVLAGDTLIWTPNEDQKGVYNFLITVSDGANIDTTKQKIIVYTQHQVSVDLAFSSVNLYEDDNMFVKIKNYFCRDNFQETTLRNTRTQEEVSLECRRVDNFNYIGQFDLSFINRSEISVANGDTIEVKYNFDNQEYLAYAYYDSLPQPTDQTPPGVINDLQITKQSGNQIKLKWTATGNNGAEGSAYKYDIRYAYEPVVSEDVYFTAYLYDLFPYPSNAGEQDSLILDLKDLIGIYEHDTIYFSIKAEDENQNRGSLSNSPGQNCLLSPENLQASIVNTNFIGLTWDGLSENLRSETNFLYYNIFRNINSSNFILYKSEINTTLFIDNLKNYPDGLYQYAVQSVYETGTSDTTFSLVVELDRFANVSVFCFLEDSLNHSGINFNMSGSDTIFSQSYNITTPASGYINLTDVFKADYFVNISKPGFETIIDSIKVTGVQNAFNFYLLDTLDRQGIYIPTGWSGISSNIMPHNSQPEQIFKNNQYALVILQNEFGIYWPGENINTLINWEPYSGYKIKVNAGTTLTIKGTELSNKTLSLQEGWNLIPVLSACYVSVEDLFSETDIVVAKEVAGTAVYWPSFGINTLQLLASGKAYFVLMGTDSQVTYPDCNVEMLPEKVHNSNKDASGLLPDDLNSIHSTASTHIIAIPAGISNYFEPEDIIGVYSEFGKLCGVTIIENPGNAYSITVYGDDPTTPEIDGFREGETMHYRMIDSKAGTDTGILVDYDDTLPNTGYFINHGLSAIANIELTNIGDMASSTLAVDIHPNPSSGVFNISLNDVGQINCKVYDVHGVCILNMDKESKDFDVDLSAYPKGIYYLNITQGGLQSIMKLVLQ